MIKQEAFKVDHPLGACLAIVAWDPENYTSVEYVLVKRFGSLARFEERTELEVRSWPEDYGLPILMVVAD